MGWLGMLWMLIFHMLPTLAYIGQQGLASACLPFASISGQGIGPPKFNTDVPQIFCVLRAFLHMIQCYNCLHPNLSQ